jgi:hypothetical protein
MKRSIYDLHSSPNIILVMKLGIMRLVGHVEGIGATGEVHTAFWWGNLRERYHLEDLRVDRRKILKLIFNKWCGGHGLAHDMDKWQTVVNAVLNFRVP